ncbi:MAG: phage holin family protein [Gemmatimonadota bacterium]
MARPQDRDPVTTGNGELQGYVVPPVDDRSLGSLIKELGDEGSRLIREEVQLAKTELREKFAVYERNTMKMVVGGVMVLGAFFVLLVAVNRGLTVLLGAFMAAEMAVWIAPLILATIAGVTGWGMTRNAQSEMKREGFTPTKTMRTLREEKNWVQQQAREVRHG